MTRRLLLPLLLLTTLAGCDLLGLESASQIAARKEAEGKAVGGACRHAGRAIEDCYTLNRRTEKAAIYAGWREMDDYMRENKLAAVPPVLTPGPAPARVADAGAPAASASEDATPPTSPDASGDASAAGDKADKADKGTRPGKSDKPGKSAHAG
jgi:hypothetical protein